MIESTYKQTIYKIIVLNETMTPEQVDYLEGLLNNEHRIAYTVIPNPMKISDSASILLLERTVS